MYRTLAPDSIVRTAETLAHRVAERFPESGLSKVAAELAQVSREAAERSAALNRPRVWLRAASWTVTAALGAGLVAIFAALPRGPETLSLVLFLQAAESAANLVVLLGAAIFSLNTLESRLKRRDALALLDELRAMAHVIDMHQLTKDPEMLSRPGPSTDSSPKRTMSAFELGRYLDYCSEMFALLGKLAALYGQRAQDAVVVDTVDGIEDLVNGLSRKVWQKIQLLHQARAAA